MSAESLPKNVILTEYPERSEDEDESLRDIYQELDLKNVLLAAIDARSPDFFKTMSKIPPYGGDLIPLTGLNKETPFIDLLGLISRKLKWPIDEFRIWDQSQFEDFVADNYDAYSTNEYRELVPKFVSLDELEVVFPLFLSDMCVVVERFNGSPPAFPNDATPKAFSRNEWWLSMMEDWKGRHPEVDRTVNEVLDVVRMERNERNNTLFNALGYLFHVFAKVKGEEEIDDMKEGLVQPSRYRASHMRLRLARFTADNAEQLEKSGLLSETSCGGKAPSAKAYAEAVMSPEHSGGDVDLMIAAVATGALVQVFDVANKKMLQYGPGFVERHGCPKRISPRYAVKLVRWVDGTYDPLAFSLENGMYLDRYEKPFCNGIYAFEWLLEQNEVQTEDFAPCASCKTIETKENKHAICSQCRTVFYCGKKCQLLHWRDGHKGVCQRRDFVKESAQSEADERDCRKRFWAEIERRFARLEGVSFYRALAENGFDCGESE